MVRLQQLEAAGKTMVILGSEDHIWGWLALRDEPRAEVGPWAEVPGGGEEGGGEEEAAPVEPEAGVAEVEGALGGWGRQR